ncbi:MAG: hypothetical protein C0595_10295 [Marinilabiliales bacterium]|nr:MAG: hypothetical protein C0595_10295 [Marinilabiliales bacterium]
MIKILIAEDSPTQATTLKFILEKSKFEVMVAYDGQEAYDMVISQTPDLIVSDIIMPKLNGFELCEKLKSNKATSHIPIILLTSLSATEDLFEAIKAGASNFITKPYKPEYLISQIQKVLKYKINNENNEDQLRVEMTFPGSKDRLISANPQQVLNLLISSYEAAIQRNEELTETQKELRNINEHLEEIVEERTKLLSREIEERKKTQDQLNVKNIQLENLNSEKDKLFSIIAHDLRSPFSGFIGLTKVMSENASTFGKDKIVHYTKRLHNTAANIFDLLNNLLEWANINKRVANSQFSNFDLFPLVNSNIELVSERAKQKNIKIKSNLSSNQFVFADREMINIAVRNLITNALKFTDKGGEIEISSTIDDTLIELSIKDSGVGIPPEKIKKLFKIDEETGTKGTDGEPSTGLGLVLCKEFIEKNGGELKVQSEPDVGSDFSFTIPRGKKPSEIEKQEMPSIENISQTNDKKRKIKILIAEDDIASQMFLKVITKNISDDVFVVDNGVEAVKTINSNDDIDVILMDIQMPLLSGDEATKKIREFNKDVIIIANSAFNQFSESSDFKEIGFDHFISKPINKDKLIELLNELI